MRSIKVLLDLKTCQNHPLFGTFSGRVRRRVQPQLELHESAHALTRQRDPAPTRLSKHCGASAWHHDVMRVVLRSKTTQIAPKSHYQCEVPSSSARLS